MFLKKLRNSCRKRKMKDIVYNMKKNISKYRYNLLKTLFFFSMFNVISKAIKSLPQEFHLLTSPTKKKKKTLNLRLGLQIIYKIKIMSAAFGLDTVPTYN